MADENKQGQQPATLGHALKSAMKEVTDPFVNLVKAPRALWGVNVTNLLEGLVYFGVLTVLGKYLSENVGLSDLHAGWVMSFMTGGITLAMLFLGGMADKVGVRKALLISLCFLVAGRALLALSSTLPGGGMVTPMFFSVVGGLILVVIGYGMFQPASYAGVKQFTDEKTKAIGYAMLYGLMNLGSFFSGIVSPPVRQATGIGGVYTLYTVLTLLALIALFFILTRKTVVRDTLTAVDAAPAAPGQAAKPVGKVLTLKFLLFSQLAVVGVVGLIAVNALRTVPPVEEGMRKVNALMNETTQIVSGDVNSAVQSRVELLRKGAAALQAVDSDLIPGAVPSGAIVENEVYTLLKRCIQAETALLRAAAETPIGLESGVSNTSPAAVLVRQRIRELGIAQMATAYRFASPVTPAVLEGLQLRNKLPGEEEPVPVSKEFQAELMSWMEAKPAEAVGRLAGYTLVLADALMTQTESRVGVLRQVMLADAAVLQEAAALMGTASGEALLGFVQERLLDMSVFYLNDVASLYAPPEEGAQGGEATGAMALQARSVAIAGLTEKWTDSAKDAVHLPTDKRLTDWGIKYGGFLLMLVVFGFLAIRTLIRQKPDHPFNDGPFVFFIFVLIPVQTLFAHNWLTLPYYINRAFGGTWVGENFEFFSNLNPILIFILSPIVAAFTVKSNVYRMMILGTLVMASPTFLLALGPNPALLMVYTLVMSIGEAMWQPRFLQWVAEVAPEGKTGMYMGIAQFPWFLTKVVTGAYSGYFLSQYCPMVGPQNTELMWLIYGAIAMVTPVSLFLARKWANKT